MQKRHFDISMLILLSFLKGGRLLRLSKGVGMVIFAGWKNTLVHCEKSRAKHPDPGVVLENGATLEGRASFPVIIMFRKEKSSTFESGAKIVGAELRTMKHFFPRCIWKSC